MTTTPEPWPRIAPLEDPDEEQAKLLAHSLPGPDGRPLNVFRTLVRSPELMKRMNGLGGYFFVHGTIATRERELIVLRTASTARSSYEIGQHRWICAEAGLNDDEIEAALDAARPHDWSPADRALLRFTDQLLATDSVTADAWAALESYGDQGRMELLVLVGYYRLLAGVLNGIGVELDASVAARVGS
jgi:4-carboxymuconolactone decarboxylase